MARFGRTKDARSDFFPGFADVAEVGTGSLATVYRARELGTNRLVALKLLNVRDVSARALESFERESIALGAVSSHPNIVTLYRTFRSADGRPVLVLELCRGAISQTSPGARGMPVPYAVAVGVKIAGALETAHRAQILHRDVKPQNILITEFGEPALADFGVARLQSATQTTAGLFDFTTLHAAPELLEGGATSAATDVYELASTLYQLIAGRSAFRAYEGESPASVILRILRDPVQPLANAHVPAQLSDLLIYAMNKSKENRPATAAGFAAELANVERAQGWPPTQFLVRDSFGPGAGYAVPPPGMPLPGMPPASPPRPASLARPAFQRPTAVPPVATPPPHPYPVPPSPPYAAAPHAVHQQPSAPPQAPRIDPMSLRRRVRLRTGLSSLTVDETQLVLRSGLRRAQLDWQVVRGFDVVVDAKPGREPVGRVLVITDSGPVQLPATRRALTDVHSIRALLDAYRARAALLGRRSWAPLR